MTGRETCWGIFRDSWRGEMEGGYSHNIFCICMQFPKNNLLLKSNMIIAEYIKLPWPPFLPISNNGIKSHPFTPIKSPELRFILFSFSQTSPLKNHQQISWPLLLVYIWTSTLQGCPRPNHCQTSSLSLYLFYSSDNFKKKSLKNVDQIEAFTLLTPIFFGFFFKLQSVCSMSIHSLLKGYQ